ncbi:hypothetical protein [Butyricicoccus sp.]|uniref:hypothetical protein n=1 Tax=Butyricicoccus sp. TaxID=2049021 RepID=UPI003F17CEE3
MKQTKIISSLLSFTIFLSCSVLAVDANTSIDESNSLASRLESSGQLEQINPNESYSNVISSETVTSDLQATISSSDLLDYCSISDETINHSALVEDASNSNIVREVYLEDGSVIGMDDAYNILSITDFSSEDSSDDVLYGQNSTIEQVVSYYGLQDNYQCNIEDDINGYIKYTWEKILSGGIVNPYDSVTLILDKDTYAIRVLNRFNEVAPVQTTAITEEQAKQIALTCQENFEAVTACKLTYVQPNFFWNEEQIAYEPCDILELVYECVIDNQYIVDVDAETGEIIGGDSYK